MTEPDGGQSSDEQRSSQPQPYLSGPQAPYSGPQAPYGGPPVPYRGPQPPYAGQQQAQYVYLAAPPKNDLAVWSMVTGILSWICCPLVLGVVAIVTGYASKRAVRDGLANNAGMATAGLILGWINVGVVAAIFAVWVFFAVVAFLGTGIATIQG